MKSYFFRLKSKTYLAAFSLWYDWYACCDLREMFWQKLWEVVQKY